MAARKNSKKYGGSEELKIKRQLGRIQKKYGSSEELKGAILAIDLQLKGVAMDPSGIRVKS